MELVENPQVLKYGYKIVVDSDRYFIYETPNGKFSVMVKYLENGKETEWCVSYNNYCLDDALRILESFELDEDYDQIIEKKKLAREINREFAHNRNIEYLKIGKHQFQTNPEFQTMAVEAAKVWMKVHPKEMIKSVKHMISVRKYSEESRARMGGNGGGGGRGDVKNFGSPWDNPEHRAKMEIVLRNNNISGKTKEGLNRMLSDPVKGAQHRKAKSEKAVEMWKDNNYRRAVINGLLNAMKSGDWQIPYFRSIKGWYHSRKIDKDIFYRSSYELLMFRILDLLENVIWYDTECLRIEYKLEELLHIVVPDVLAEFSDNKMAIIETKSQYMLSDSLTQTKISAIRKYADENGLLFLLITETEMEILGWNDIQEELIKFS